MQITDFIKKAAAEGSFYTTEVDHKKEIVRIYFDDGSRAEFGYDDWFYLFEAACHIISINDELSQS